MAGHKAGHDEKRPALRCIRGTVRRSANGRYGK
jgi:hypothetical protein